MDGKLYANTGSVDISPGKGIELAGYPHCPRNNTGIHDPLKASCICIRSGSKTTVIVCADLLIISKKCVSEIRKSAEIRTGVHGSDITVCCTHTHSAPWTSGRLDLEALESEAETDSAYVRMFIEKTVDLICKTITGMHEASIGIGRAICGKESGVGGNRRDRNGPCDPEVSVLGIKDNSGKMRAVLVNYALHPTVLHSDNTLVSGDFPFYIRNYLENQYPGAVVMFAQGASGNQSTRYFRTGQTFEEAHRIGGVLAKAAYEALEKADFKRTAFIRSKSIETDFIYRKLPDIEKAKMAVDKSRQNVSELKASGASQLDIWNAELKMYGSEDILAYAILDADGRKPLLAVDETGPELKVVLIGDACFVFLPGEIFVEFGLEIKKNSGFGSTFVIELANGGAPGYVYTREALEDGGYETDTSMLAPQMGDEFVRICLLLIDDLRKEVMDNVR